MPLNSSVQRLAPEPVQVRGTCASPRLAAVPGSPRLGLGVVDEPLLAQGLHGGDQTILDEVLQDHRAGHGGPAVLDGGDARTVRALTELLVEPLEVFQRPGGDRLAEQGVRHQEAADAVHHPELLPGVVRIIQPVEPRLHLGYCFPISVPVAGVLDARAQEQGDQGLLAVSGGEGAVVRHLAVQAELTRQHPLLLTEGGRQVRRDLPNFRRLPPVARNVRQDVARGHGGFITTTGTADLRGEVPGAGHRLGPGERVGQVAERVVPVDLAHVRIVLDDRGSLRVEDVHRQHSGQHGDTLTLLRPTVQTHDGQEPVPVDPVQDLVVMCQRDALIDEGFHGAEGDVVAVAVHHDDLAGVDATHEVLEDPAHDRAVLTHRDDDVRAATGTPVALDGVGLEVFLGGLVEVPEFRTIRDLAERIERLTVATLVRAASELTLEGLIRGGGLGHGSLLGVYAGLHYFSRKVAFGHIRLLDVYL